MRVRLAARTRRAAGVAGRPNRSPPPRARAGCGTAPELERLARFENSNGRTKRVGPEALHEPADRVMCPGRDVVKGSPVVGNEYAAVQPLEQRQRVVVREVSPPKPRSLPPWCIADR